MGTRRSSLTLTKLKSFPELWAAERLTANPNTGTFGEGRDEPITTQPSPLDLNHPLAIETRQGAGPIQLSPSDDEISEEGQPGSSGGGGGEPPGRGGSLKQLEENRTPRGSTSRLPEHLGKSGQQGGNPQKPPGDAPSAKPGQVVEESDANTSCWPCCK